jgi:RNA polymerase sigma-70 factor (ECF subfamily)
LIQRLANPADSVAWERFEKCYQLAIYRYARSRGLQQIDAIDVVQEVLLAVHRQAARWEPTGRAGSFRAWLAETARRVTLQVIRFRDRTKSSAAASSIVEALATMPIHEDSAEDQRETDRWRFYCAAATVEAEVSQQNWRAFWMTAVEGKAAEVVAKSLSMRVGTVYSAKCRVLARIRQAVEQISASYDAHDRGES